MENAPYLKRNNKMTKVNGDNFNTVGKTFYFDSPCELLLNSYIEINVKNNNSKCGGFICSCEKSEGGKFRIGVQLKGELLQQ